jgi:putative NADPH-quinone reductase
MTSGCAVSPRPDQPGFARQSKPLALAVALSLGLAAAHGETLINLDATGQPEGALATWNNTGTLGESFTAPGTVPGVITVDGVKGVAFSAVTSTYYVGPVAPYSVCFNGSRTIEAWVWDPAPANEKNVIAWGHRDGPNGANFSFGHGGLCVGVWGGGDFSYYNGGYIPAKVITGKWTYVAVTYDGTANAITAYTNGVPSNSKVVSLATADIDSGSNPLHFLLGRQNRGDGTVAMGEGVGTNIVAKIRVHDVAMSPADILTQYQTEAPQFNPALGHILVNLDSTGQPVGPLATWNNAGTLGGSFTAPGTVPNVITVDGVNGVAFSADRSNPTYYVGPVAPGSVCSNASRTIEAWVWDPVPANENNVLAWGRRGGPNGANFSFGHGGLCVGVWGGGDFTYYSGSYDPAKVIAGKWTYVTVTYDGTANTITAYTNGMPSNSKGVTLATADIDSGSNPLPFLLGRQNNADGTVSGEGVGTNIVAKIRVYDVARSSADILAQYQAEVSQFTVVHLPLVDLDGTRQPAGPLATWNNTGTLGGSFTAPGTAPNVITVDGVNGVAFSADQSDPTYYVGPAAPGSVCSSASRTIEAWVWDPVPANEKNVIAWGHRGGPVGANFSFGHGGLCVGVWGGGDFTYYSGSYDPAKIITGKWTYVTVTYDGTAKLITAYTNGVPSNSQGGENLVTGGLDSYGNPLPFLLGRQNNADGTVAGEGAGTNIVAKIRVFDVARSPADILAQYQAEAPKFNSAHGTILSLDSTGLPVGPLATWTNTGTLGGSFTAPATVPNVITVDGVKGVAFSADQSNPTYYVGPVAPYSVCFSASRTVEAWVWDPAPANEKNVLAWGHRDGPGGANFSFGHGGLCVGVWGGGDFTYYSGGYDPAKIITGQWTYVTVTYDGTTHTITAYVNGVPSNSKGVTLATADIDSGSNPLHFLLGRQNHFDGTVAGDGVGTNIVARIRVHDAVMSEAEVLAQFEAEKLQFNPVTLQYERSGSDLILTWSQGILESADEVNGVYTPVIGATSPYTSAVTGDRKFFRVLVQ